MPATLANRTKTQAARKRQIHKSSAPASKMMRVESLSAPLIQARLRIGPPNDKYEQEADRVADDVMRMGTSESRTIPVSGVSAAPRGLQQWSALPGMRRGRKIAA